MDSMDSLKTFSVKNNTSGQSRHKNNFSPKVKNNYPHYPYYPQATNGAGWKNGNCPLNYPLNYPPTKQG